ncbi:hypothetical protein [Herbaspirillum aquaticum]|uniref:hypothetical protein n=1 Tax=Herbaspirillum aquaticum TaxID=568783 RepID=UPI0024DE5828|nr:hypothetical protein [Herbaspirillum aquaticum]
MKWYTLPGAANFIDDVIRQMREGVSIVVATPSFGQPNLEDAFVEALKHANWWPERATIDSHEDPLRWLTDELYLEPAQWVGWSAESLCSQLRAGQLIVIDGVTELNWDDWRTFLRDFELASRQRPSEERPVLLVFVRGVPQKRLQIAGAALAICIWSGVLSELDILIYVDQRLSYQRKRSRHHKLIVRQIAALALWDLELADYLVDQPEYDLFDIQLVLNAARGALGRDKELVGRNWESGGLDQFEGAEMMHSFSLLDSGDPERELQRRVWTAQAAELLPLIEIRRRELIRSLDRHISCPFWIDSKRKIESLDELEIGSLAYVTQTHRIQGELRDRAEWLAHCRNVLAHLGLLDNQDALDSRLYQ